MDAFFVLLCMSFIFVMFSQCYYRKTKHSNGEAAELPPGPKPWPLVGCLPTMLTTNMPTYKWIHAVMKQFNTEIACIRLGSTYIIPVSSPEIALEFLKINDSIFASRSCISNTVGMLSHGYLTTALSPMGEQWRKMRRILTSEIFNPSTLHRMVGHRNIEADTLLRYVFSQTSNRDGGVVNIRSITQHYCGNIMRRMIFNKRYYGKGREDGGPTFEEEEHNQALFTMIEYIYAFSISDFVPWLKPFDLDGHQKIMKKALNVVQKYDEPIIDERVQRWKDGKMEGVKDDILDILISLKDENAKPMLSVAEIKAQITELQIAAIDNPSNIVEWAMAELMNEPKILEKAMEELDKVIGRERVVEESDIPNLKYLTACIRETFRIHQFSPFNLPHVSNSDITIAGYFIPKGSEVFLSRIGLGRNPRTWEDPMKFNPERHMKDTTTELGLLEPNLRFITFSRGRRGCLGSSLGTTITMMLFARLLQGFSWSLLPGITKIDFSEADELSLPKPLHLHGKPRLSHVMYPRLIYSQG
ncbi:isoleucine N-monooxygenase 1-like [Cucurbita moschata]|uniref:Isoleucine N-monooxygenase 1-like n=1 Tax=Cucurbita moschata TaxID=3662 RepID=A0A6J1H9G3_CUCMO|nr:isoleucine N-monooxygenase 1-like [Cucurbita moschata]